MPPRTQSVLVPRIRHRSAWDQGAPQEALAIQPSKKRPGRHCGNSRAATHQRASEPASCSDRAKRAATFLQFDEDEGTWSLVLVNASNPLPDGFSVETADVGGGHSVDKRIADSLNAMLEDCRRAGYHPFIRSSFRTRDEQQQILNERVELYREAGYSGEDALSAALQWVALPGTSEHELGLAVDINDEEDDEGMYTWLASNAHQYGFILRYPLDKVDVTGISNEPWHYRYVGKQTAGEIYQTGEALEEYLARSK